MSKGDKIFYFGMLPFMLFIMIAMLVWFINWNKIENKKRYEKLPDISVVEEKLEEQLFTQETFSYIRYEFLDEDVIVYYFVFDEPRLYYKVIYNFRNNGGFSKKWQYYQILPSWEQEAYNE